MDTFQGHYKDGTNNTIDYQFFSGATLGFIFHFHWAHITLLLHRFQNMVDLVSFLVHLSTLHALCSTGLLQERGFHSGFFTL